MNLPDHLLPLGIYVLGWVLFIPILVYAIRKAPWKRLKESGPLNVWLGMIVVLIFIWQLKAGVSPGLSLHQIGATLFTLCFGPYLAFVGLSLITAATAFNGDTGYWAYGLNVLLVAGVGVVVAHGIFKLVERYLPNNYFIYIFVTCFFGSAVNYIVITLLGSLFLALFGVYSLEYLFTQHQPFTLLLAFSEAWLNGAVMALLVVYLPSWVSSFDDARYLRNK